MRKVFRNEDNELYWDRRWAEAGADADEFRDFSIYPIRYAEMVMTDRSAKALEIGAGLGRVLKHYRTRGFDITGIERSQVAVDRLKSDDPSMQIERADVMALPMADGTYDVVMAFGVYHNIEHGLDRALAETARVLRPGGRFCISMRPDNVEMRLNEVYWRRRQRGPAGEPKFHKWLVTPKEFAAVLRQHGLVTDTVHYARNVSLLYRLPFLRARTASETERRSSGYRLNAAGRVLDRALLRAAPGQFCNVIVFVGRKH